MPLTVGGTFSPLWDLLATIVRGCALITFPSDASIRCRENHAEYPVMSRFSAFAERQLPVCPGRVPGPGQAVDVGDGT
jgi:hypothetical protein